jgi:hypothetical protein
MGKKNKHFDRRLFDEMIKEFRLKHVAEFAKPNWSHIVLEILINEEDRLKSSLDKSKKSIQFDTYKSSFSGDTVKRVFKVIDYNKSHTERTCSVIARTLNYASWDDFLKKSEERYNTENGFQNIDVYSLNTSDINKVFCIGWFPDKYCKLMYLDDYSFKVTENYGLRSNIDRVFQTTRFRHVDSNSESAYPDIFIEPFDEDDPNWEFIDFEIYPVDYLL